MNKSYETKKIEFENIINNLLQNKKFMGYFNEPNEKCDFRILTEKLGVDYKDLIYAGGELKNEIFGNSKLLLLGYKITKDLKNNINDIPDNITTQKRTEDISNYDCTTGNFHPCKKRVAEEYNYYGIRQIVLCNKNLSHRGPKTDYDLPEEERVLKKLKRIPKANFYPLIDEESKLISEEELEKQKFLKQLFELIEKENIKVKNEK